MLYNVHASAMPASLIKRLPGCVRIKIAWLGSPIVGDGFHHFNMVVSNFPSINARHRALGLHTEYFIPSYEPGVEEFTNDTPRRIDIFFAGGFTRHHRSRAELLEKFACAFSDEQFALYLDNSRYTWLADTPLGYLPPLSLVRRPKAIRRISKPAIFGREMLQALSRSRIVINMAIDMAMSDRGNIRCFEALSAGALLLSDKGNYPQGFRDGETMITYESVDEALHLASSLLAEPQKLEAIANAGNNMIRTIYSKQRQWERFQELIAQLVG